MTDITTKAKRVLILEDDAYSVKLYRVLLSDYTVDVATCLSEAIALMERHDYDVYVVDVHIKGSIFTGIDLVNLIRDKYKVIITTTMDIDYFLNTQYQEIKKLRKPVKNEEFIQSVKQIVEGFKE